MVEEVAAVVDVDVILQKEDVKEDMIDMNVDAVITTLSL